jgi:hypothetical protein
MQRLQEMSTDRTAEKVLCFIEKQAVIQVLIQQVAALFDPKDPKKIQNVSLLTNILQVSKHVLLIYFLKSCLFGDRRQLCQIYQMNFDNVWL